MRTNKDKVSSLVVVLIFILATFFVSYILSNLFFSDNDKGINQNIKDELEDIDDVVKADRENGCNTDNDCFLKIEDDFGCGCGSVCGNYFCNGGCDPIDLSSEKWVAVNKAWFIKTREDICMPKSGPCPQCLSRPINENFVGKCIDDICKKVSI